MKIIKIALHYWIALVSVLSFLVGWGMLAHSLKPVQPSQTSTRNTVSLPALPPIQAFGGGTRNNGGGGLNFSAPNNQSSLGFPILRSGGS
ncbi:MAG TPA: hypothetical protein VF359_03375 [Anaerolineales bacterium]|jgi:hypothetical protein